MCNGGFGLTKLIDSKLTNSPENSDSPAREIQSGSFGNYKLKTISKYGQWGKTVIHACASTTPTYNFQFQRTVQHNHLLVQQRSFNLVYSTTFIGNVLF